MEGVKGLSKNEETNLARLRSVFHIPVQSKSAFRWVVEWEGLDAWIVKHAITCNRLHLSFFEPIVPSAAQKMTELIRRLPGNHCNLTLKMINPTGAIVETLQIENLIIDSAHIFHDSGLPCMKLNGNFSIISTSFVNPSYLHLT